MPVSSAKKPPQSGKSGLQTRIALINFKEAIKQHLTFLGFIVCALHSVARYRRDLECGFVCGGQAGDRRGTCNSKVIQIYREVN